MLSAIAIFAALGLTQAQFNNPPSVDIWCGKAYRATNASFNPGGQFARPSISNVPLLNFRVGSRMSLYLDDEDTGSLLVDASISDIVGEPLPFNIADSITAHSPTWTLEIKYYLNGNTSLPVNSTVVKLGDKQVEQAFDLSLVPTSLEPHNVTAIATLKGTNATFHASTQVSKLPQKPDNGSVTRLDHLYGGLSVRKVADEYWRPIFPYTYYVQWSLYWYANLSTLDEFSSMGYNIIHIVPTGDLGDTPFPWDEFEPYLARADELGLYFQFDVRWDYTNLTLMTEIVTRLSSHPSILLWYTGDEPDGKGDPINSTQIAYDAIRSIDPYHPVSLALNCYDFYYSSYASGAEIILSDVYPISTNTSWSTVYDTPCNATYGDCGCDDCHGSFADISDRLDNFAYFDDVLGWQKTHWGAPQAFGNETFWTRYPTAAEEVVMSAISINHAAKGIVMWDFPTTAEILNVTNAFATALTSTDVAKYFIGAPLTSSLKVSGAEGIDAAVWVAEDSVLLSVVNLNYGNIREDVTVHLPSGIKVSQLEKAIWGGAVWAAASGRPDSVSTNGLLGLQVSLLIMRRG